MLRRFSMSTDLRRSYLRTIAHLAALLAICAAVVLIGTTIIENKSRIAAEKAALAALLADPDVRTLIDTGHEVCAGAEYSYIWICGVTLKLTRSDQDSSCSKQDSPWFVGDIRFTDPQPAKPQMGKDFWSWSWSEFYKLENGRMVSCSGADCALMGFYAAEEGTKWGPSEPLVEDPEWPDFTDLRIYGSYSLGVWASFQNMPVHFLFEPPPYDLQDLNGYQPYVSVQTRHPYLPLTIALLLQPEQREHWKEHLGAIFSRLGSSVVSTDYGKSCSNPPITARFSISRHDTQLLEKMRDWRRSQLTPD